MTETPAITGQARTLKAMWAGLLALLLAFHAMPEVRAFAPSESTVSRVSAVALPGAQFRQGNPPAQLASYRFVQTHRGADSHGGDTPLAPTAPSFAAPQYVGRAPWRVAGAPAPARHTARAYQARAPPA